MLLRLQTDDYSVNYKPGKLMFVPDMLSRAYIKDDRDNISDDIECFINMPRSYTIQTPYGNTYRRNTKHIIKTNENFENVSLDDEIPYELPNEDTVIEKEKSDNSEQPYTTRSGRTIRPPIRYKDYDELEMRKAMFIGELTKLFSSNDLHEHIIYQTLFFIDARNKDDPEIHQLTTRLVDIAFKQPSWGQPMPVAWVPLEIQLSEMKTARICKNFVKKSELQGYNLQNDDFVLTDSQFENFLKIQHSLGKLLYFGEHGIDDFIVIQPSALVNVLRSFVTDEMFWPKDKEIVEILPDLSKTGVIYRTDLYKLWEQKHFKKLIPTEDLRKFIIEVLIHLDILVEPKQYSGAGGSADFFLVPCTIKEKAPSSFFHTEEMDEKAICLSYRLKKSSVPSALFFKLIGSALNVLPIKETDGRPCLYYKAAVLSVDNDNECRIHMEGNRIVVNLINRTSRLQILPDIAASIQECLTLTLTNVLHFYYTCMGKDIKQFDILKLFDTEVGTPCGKGFCFIPVNEAITKKTWTCENKTVHTTDLLLNWMLDETFGKEECPPDCSGIPTVVLFESPSEKHLMRLASVLDITMFHDFFLHLGMETKDWHNIQYTYWQSVDAMFMALMTWRDTGSMVTFKKILDALEKVEDNQHHLCKVLKEQLELPEIAGFGFQDTPSESFLSTLPNKLGYCVLPLGIELGLRITDIESVFVRHPKQLFSQVYEVLKIWKQKTPENTYLNLMLAIQRVRGKQFLKRNFGCDN
ncbi:unnamed protein product [Mytilus coruscus]|uniref:Death domain-containing protein n=1 Tax=Mytilus coruscus TaxID=42192 RepID=A0A6J8EG52_MYTCO|nr:unnamed protein product [Mytilus coruscus]